MSAILAFGFVALMSPAGFAQDRLDINEQRFSPSPHPYDFINVMSSRVLDTFDYNVGLVLNWSADTMMFEDGFRRTDELLTGRFTGDLIASISFFRYVSLGIGLPLHFVNISGDTEAGFGGAAGPISRGNLEGFSLGDLKISPKVRILDAVDSIIGVAVALDITAPTGSSDALATEDGVTVFPRLIVDMNYKGYRAALNVGYKWRDKREIRWLTVEPEFYLAAAVGVPIIENNLEALGELEVMTSTGAFFTEQNTDYIEGRLALRYTTDFGLGVLLGGGAGMLSSWGSPLYRIFAGINYSPRVLWRDTDGDGIPDHLDACPLLWGDQPDGCPHPDRDGDGFCDPWVSEEGMLNRYAHVCKGIDRCPDEWGHAPDGCPILDRDGDGVCDPWVAEKGLSEKYADRCKGIDMCPDLPGDQEDGCPHPDRDGDGVCDPWVSELGMLDRYAEVCKGLDRCPDEWGDGPDGCPVIKVEEKQIVIRERVLFEFDSDVILPESFSILNRVVQAMKEHPEIKKLEIQGHTDSQGAAAYNMDLSQRRAQSVVEYLVKAGIERDRLVSKGFGLTKPIDTNETDEGRANNRRVELHILER